MEQERLANTLMLFLHDDCPADMPTGTPPPIPLITSSAGEQSLLINDCSMMSTNHLDLLKSNPQATLVQYLTHVAIITWTCLPALRRYLLQPFLFFLHSDLSSCISSSFSFFILRFSSRCLFEQKYCRAICIGSISTLFRRSAPFLFEFEPPLDQKTLQKELTERR